MSIREDSINEYDSRMMKVLHHINENLDKDLSLMKLSETACFSQFHFHRLFSSFMGETPNDYVKRLRVEKAANLLIMAKHLPITEIALRCGFSSSATFARAFKDHFNYSASEWREFGHREYSENIKSISKNCKTASKNGKEFPEEESHFYSVDNFLQNDSSDTKLKVEVKIMPALHIAYVIHHEGYNSKIGKAFEKLCRWAGPRGYINEYTLFLGLSLDNPDITPPDKCRYYASMTVPAEVKEEKGIGVMDIPEMKCAVYRFEGNEDEIEPAYEQFYRVWLKESGYQPADFPTFEIYLRTPDKKAGKEFLTDVCVPIKPL